MTRPTKRPARETSDRVSRISAKWLRKWERGQQDEPWMRERKSDWAPIQWGDLLALCGSALAQDTTKGRRK